MKYYDSEQFMITSEQLQVRADWIQFIQSEYKDKNEHCKPFPNQLSCWKKDKILLIYFLLTAFNISFDTEINKTVTKNYGWQI